MNVASAKHDAQGFTTDGESPTDDDIDHSIGRRSQHNLVNGNLDVLVTDEHGEALDPLKLAVTTWPPPVGMKACGQKRAFLFRPVRYLGAKCLAQAMQCCSLASVISVHAAEWWALSSNIERCLAVYAKQQRLLTGKVPRTPKEGLVQQKVWGIQDGLLAVAFAGRMNPSMETLPAKSRIDHRGRIQQLDAGLQLGLGYTRLMDRRRHLPPVLPRSNPHLPRGGLGHRLFVR
mmetsp:Transcript_62730/g.181808  ORF Transcript_62730/g.181808 Transcript_62730/m.181808 type:complete len:232 (-) Transcript_62730:761-1456(-)